MKSWVTVLVVIAVLYSSLAAAAAAAEATVASKGAADALPTGTRIKAKVVRSDGKTPADKAVLKAFHLDTGKTLTSEPCSPQGNCEIQGVPRGYVDIAVETPDGTFAANQVVLVPPSTTVAMTVTLTKFSEKSPAWWTGFEPRDLPGGGKPSAGLADVRTKLRGKEYWKSPKGIAIIAGVSAAVLIAIAASSSGGDSASPYYP